MSSTSPNKKNLFSSPDIYESSYKNIFRYVDFNFLFFSKTNLIKKAGRPDYPEHALSGALVLKSSALNISSGTTEAITSQDSELTILIGFNDWNTSNDSTLRYFFSDITLEKIKMVQNSLLKALQALGYTKARIIALDSTPIDSHCKVPMKRRKPAKDPDTR